MRTGGLPCRTVGCDQSFQVLDQGSMESLKAAGAARNEHEVAIHSYNHVKLADESGYMPRQGVRRKPAGQP